MFALEASQVSVDILLVYSPVFAVAAYTPPLTPGSLESKYSTL